MMLKLNKLPVQRCLFNGFELQKGWFAFKYILTSFIVVLMKKHIFELSFLTNLL